MIYDRLKATYRILKLPIRIARSKYKDMQTNNYVSSCFAEQTGALESFDFYEFKKTVLGFVSNMQFPNNDVQFKYSDTCTVPTLYSSVYACMLYSILGELNALEENKRQSWIGYFDSFQNETDGLFYDPAVTNEIYADSDWWGARHLALHIINAYTCLDARPKFPFRFLEPYYDIKFFNKLLEENNDMFQGAMENDFDNKLMNIVCLLQYQRDLWNDTRAGEAVAFVQRYLLEKLNPVTGIWGDDNIDDADQRSRKVQFAYHLLPIFLYDKIYAFDFNRMAKVVMKTQNKFGGFGVPVNSSACEDIDSIDILVRISEFTTGFDAEIKETLERGFRWVLVNQMKDGGFVFRLNDEFTYGHVQMSSKKNAGAMFPTWFRTLSLAYLNEYFKLTDRFNIVRCPGL